MYRILKTSVREEAYVYLNVNKAPFLYQLIRNKGDPQFVLVMPHAACHEAYWVMPDKNHVFL